MLWSSVHIIHSNPMTTSWSGLSESDMSASAAAHADRKFPALMGKLAGWVKGHVVGKESRSLSGVDAVTIADLVLMASVQYLEEVYGVCWWRILMY